MLTKRTKIMFFMAFSLAVLAAWMANYWVQNRMNSANNQQAAVTVKTKPVVVASQKISYGQKIEAVQLKLVDWPAELLPSGALHSLEEANNKVALFMMSEGDPVTESKVASHLGGSHLAALLGKHKRAVSVRVDDVVGVAGFLSPGNRVDVLGIKKFFKNGTSKIKVRTVLSDIRVLAVDQDVSHDKNKPKVVRAVTLELSAGQAEDIVKASAEGKIRLSLRNPNDRFVAKKPVKKKVYKKKRVKKYKPKPAPVHITVIRGVDITKEKPNI